MICPYCGNEKTRVVATIKGLQNVRFRRCDACEKTWSTIEIIKTQNPPRPLNSREFDG